MSKSRIVELYGYYTGDESLNWGDIINKQIDKYTGKKSNKTRKSFPEQTIGTTVVKFGKDKNAIIDPTRFYENSQVFFDCIHLLKNHVPGNILHLIPEVKIPGGNVDFFLVSVRDNKVQDFVGIELQALDTTGTLWPERQLFLKEKGLLSSNEVIEKKIYGINWKMTSKTILVQLEHKVRTFENLNKNLVLVVQDVLLDYMQNNFDFSEVREALHGDVMQFHPYSFKEDKENKSTSIVLEKRLSTDSNGVSKILGLKQDPNIDLEEIEKILLRKISKETILKIKL